MSRPKNIYPPADGKNCPMDLRRSHRYSTQIHGLKIVERTWSLKGIPLYIVELDKNKYLANEERVFIFTL